MTNENILEKQLRELGATELELEQEISNLPKRIREASMTGDEQQATSLENRLKTVREEAKSLQTTIRQLEARLYTIRRRNSNDRSR